MGWPSRCGNLRCHGSAGRRRTYVASCTISAAATGSLVNTATLTEPGGVTDPTPGNNSATDTDTLVVVPSGATVTGTNTVTGTFTVGGTVTYTVTLNNSGPGAQGDNPGDELTDVLPPELDLVSATASSGTAAVNTVTAPGGPALKGAGTNTVTWNGAIPAAGSVTITITATILPSAAGMTVSNQATIAFDGDGNGTNESSAVTDDPGQPGSGDPTSFLVAGGVAPMLEIPVLSTFGLLLLGLVLAALGFFALMKRRNVA